MRRLAALGEDLRGGIVAVRPMADGIYAQAERLALKQTARLGTRTLDILHVACAAAPEADTFLIFDDRQTRLAAAAWRSIG